MSTNFWMSLSFLVRNTSSCELKQEKSLLSPFFFQLWLKIPLYQRSNCSLSFQHPYVTQPWCSVRWIVCQSVSIQCVTLLSIPKFIQIYMYTTSLLYWNTIPKLPCCQSLFLQGSLWADAPPFHFYTWALPPPLLHCHLLVLLPHDSLFLGFCMGKWNDLQEQLTDAITSVSKVWWRVQLGLFFYW